jgi:hypothetical protein
MVIISSATDDELLWARFTVCQGRETGFSDKNQPVPGEHHHAIQSLVKKSHTEMELTSQCRVQKPGWIITYIFKIVINFFQNPRTMVQDFELSATMKYFILI